MANFTYLSTAEAVEVTANGVASSGEQILRLVELFFEFAKVGLFSVGGGLATIPFLQDMGKRTGWFTPEELATMIAVSESTPGPMGINMASYVGFQSGGILGAMVASFGVITPCVIIILLVATMLEKFKDSKAVQGLFYGLRPASAALILSAAVQVAQVGLTEETELGFVLSPPSVVLALGLWGAMFYSGKKLHPVIYVFLSALLGMAFQL